MCIVCNDKMYKNAGKGKLFLYAILLIVKRKKRAILVKIEQKYEKEACLSLNCTKKHAKIECVKGKKLPEKEKGVKHGTEKEKIFCSLEKILAAVFTVGTSYGVSVCIQVLTYAVHTDRL